MLQSYTKYDFFAVVDKKKLVCFTYALAYHCKIAEKFLCFIALIWIISTLKISICNKIPQLILSLVRLIISATITSYKCHVKIQIDKT